MGSDIPKQFLRLGDKTILQLSMERIGAAVDGVRMIVVLPSEFIPFWQEECDKSEFRMRHIIVKGGLTRFHSVKNALVKLPDGAVVAVHDGVRPFASAVMVRNLFAEAVSNPAVVPVIPVTDTLKVLKRDSSGNLVEVDGAGADRSVLFGAQTPQLFWSEILKKAYNQPYDTAFTDDASVVSRDGTPVHYIPGDRNNIKITTPEDLLLASRLL